MPRPKTTPEVRFFAKVSNTDPLACWLWTGTRNHLGYGQFWNGSKTVRAHRWAYEFLRAEIMPGWLAIDHECDNRGCVNPWHLDVVTGSENMKRSVIRGRWRSYAPENHRRGEPPLEGSPHYRRRADQVADKIDAGEWPVAGVLTHNRYDKTDVRALDLLVRWGYVTADDDGRHRVLARP